MWIKDDVMKKKRYYAIGIVLLIVFLSVGLVMCKKNNNLSGQDKDELKDSDYITGTSDKFDDTVDDSEEEPSDESHADKNDIPNGSDKDNNSSNVTTGNSNSDVEEKQPESENENNKEEDNKEEVNKEDDDWTGFY